MILLSRSLGRPLDSLPVFKPQTLRRGLLLAMTLALGACGGGSSDSSSSSAATGSGSSSSSISTSSSSSSSSSSAPIVGVATPSEISVVTATNAT